MLYEELVTVAQQEAHIGVGQQNDITLPNDNITIVT